MNLPRYVENFGNPGKILKTPAGYFQKMQTHLIKSFSFKFNISPYRGGGGHYGAPYDSTQGVPNYVFIGFWIIIILFFIRLAWEYRDEIFRRKG